MVRTISRETDYPITSHSLQHKRSQFLPPVATVDFEPLLERIADRDPLAAEALLDLSRIEPIRGWQIIRVIARLLDEADGRMR